MGLRNFVVGVCRGHTPDIRNCYEGENGQKKFTEPNEIHIRIRPQASISGPCQTLAHYISETFILVYPGGEGWIEGVEEKGGEKRMKTKEGGSLLYRTKSW